jgi:crossover junction endodeoxyribonuclease RuvC
MNTLPPGATGRQKVLGIDIGLAGAIAILDENGMLQEVHDMPVLADGSANRRTINTPLLADILRDGPVDHAFVEFISARPGEGAVGAFSFGRCKGVVEGCLGTLGIPTTFITPPCWKRAVGLPTGTNKDASRSMAIAKWPNHAE